MSNDLQDEEKNRHTALTIAITKLLRPLVRLLLKSGFTLKEFSNIAARVFVDVAEVDFVIEGRRQTISRIAALTGIQRKVVARLSAESLLPDVETPLVSRNRAATVLTAWLRDERFLDRKGDPEALPFDGDRSFSELVRQYSGDITPRTIADELKRLDALEEVDGKLRLTARGYQPVTGSIEQIDILGEDTADLITTIDRNISGLGDPMLYQQKVMYDDVPVEYLPVFTTLSNRLAQRLLEDLDLWLASHDRDSGSQLLGSGRARVGLGIYQIEEILDVGENGEAQKGQDDEIEEKGTERSRL
jgi:hypothetical protein